MRFIQLRGGGPRMLPRMRRWLTARVMMPDGTVEDGESGTPQGGSISVLLSKVSLPYVLDWWCEKQRRKPRAGEASGVRYLADVVLCVPYRSDALRVHKLLEERLHQCGLDLAPEKTRRIACGRFAQRDAATQGQQRPETFSFWGCTPYCTRHRQGHFTVERSTERTRLQRATQTIQRLLRAMRHAPGPQQPQARNPSLRGHYNYDGRAGNRQRLLRLYRLTETLWRKTFRRRSQDGEVHWEKLQKLKPSFPLARPT